MYQDWSRWVATLREGATPLILSYLGHFLISYSCDSLFNSFAVGVNCEMIPYFCLYFQEASLGFLFMEFSYKHTVIDFFSILHYMGSSPTIFNSPQVPYDVRRDNNIPIPNFLIKLLLRHQFVVVLYRCVLTVALSLMNSVYAWPSVHVWHIVGEYGVILDHPLWSLLEFTKQSEHLRYKEIVAGILVCLMNPCKSSLVKGLCWLILRVSR